jgi:hypothetical protein
MSISYGQDVFTLLPGQSINLDTIFNSSDFNAGGDYVGPLVVAGIALNLHETMTPSTVGVEFTKRNDDGLSSNCIYHYSIRNDSGDNAALKIHFFYN